MSQANQYNFVIDILRDKELLIYEDVQGSKIYVKWTGKKFLIKPKSVNMEPLNFIDLTVQMFYNDARTAGFRI